MMSTGKENITYIKKGKSKPKAQSTTRKPRINIYTGRTISRDMGKGGEYDDKTGIRKQESQFVPDDKPKKDPDYKYEGAKGKDGMVTPSSSTGQKSREEKKFPKGTKMKKTKTKKRLFGGWESRGKKGLVSESGRGGPYSYAKGDVKGRKATWKSGHYDDSEYYDDGKTGMLARRKKKMNHGGKVKKGGMAVIIIANKKSKK